MDATNSAASLPGQDRFRVWSCEELDAETPPLDYIVQDVLVSGQPCVIAGSVKCLKTSIAVDLALSVATGTPFLGKFPVDTARPVLIFSAESGKPAIRDLLRRMSKARGVEFPKVPLLKFIDDVPRLDNEKDVAAVAKLIREYGTKLLIVDPCYMAMPGEHQASLSKQGEMLRTMGRVCELTGTTLAMVHHFKKPSPMRPSAGPPVLDDLSGSGHAEFARQWILLKRRSVYRVGSGYHDLRCVVGGSAGHQGDYALAVDEGNDDRGRGWSVRVLSADELDREQSGKDEKKAKTQADLDERVLAYLTEAGPAPAKQIRTELKPMPNPDTLSRSLERLEAAGTIAAADEKRKQRGKPVRVYSITNVDAA